jgi:hypothetical protein
MIIHDQMLLTYNLTMVQEEQELGELVALHQQHNSSHGGERPVEVVIRDPCIAARYPKNESTVQLMSS